MSGKAAFADMRPGRKSSFRVLSVRVEPELMRELQGKATSLRMNVSDLVRSYVLTGLFLHDVDAFLRSRMDEDTEQGGSRRVQACIDKESATGTRDVPRIEEVFSAARSECTAKSNESNQVRRTAEVLKVRMDTTLLDEIRKRMRTAAADMSSYVRWCIRSGLFLENLDRFHRSKSGEDETMD